jgi:hypothetical protein
LDRSVKLRLVVHILRMIPKIPSVERIVHILAIIVDHNLALAAIMRVGSYLIISLF